MHPEAAVRCHRCACGGGVEEERLPLTVVENWYSESGRRVETRGVESLRCWVVVRLSLKSPLIVGARQWAMMISLMILAVLSTLRLPRNIVHPPLLAGC